VAALREGVKQSSASSASAPALEGIGPAFPENFFMVRSEGAEDVNIFKAFRAAPKNMRCFTVANGGFQSRSRFSSLDINALREAQRYRPTTPK
jgi:hypothetical protein